MFHELGLSNFQSINQCFYFRQRGPYETKTHKKVKVLNGYDILRSTILKNSQYQL